MRHIDFDAFWDGPVINPDDDIKQQIDDLILCEECLASAVKRLGYDKVDADRIGDLEKRLFETTARAEQAERAFQKVQDAMPRPEVTGGTLPPPEAPKRRGRPPKVRTA